MDNQTLGGHVGPPLHHAGRFVGEGQPFHLNLVIVPLFLNAPCDDLAVTIVLKNGIVEWRNNVRIASDS